MMEIVGKSGINLTLAVLGTGQMGRGIVQLALQRGMKVIFVSRTQQRLAAVQNEIETFFLKSMSKQEAETLLQDNLLLSTNMASVAEADVVIESVTEDRTAKKNLFSVLNKVCSSKTIIVTNTSSLSVTELAERIDNPSRVAGLHFFNPVHKMELVEIIRTAQTSDETINFLTELSEKLGKKPVLAKDNPGFIVNRVLIPYLLEAVHLFEQGVGKEDIDQAAKLGLNHPMGPLALIDFIGVDIFQNIIQNLHDATSDQKFTTPTVIKKMINEGKLGRKSGGGFYSYLKS
ncbi:3-hydroxyacyl-CoA dehydrogenase family protein [Candidatus Woesearchaeota archaeon]|nr:3-hydroxyacyl-CoA dehydrogenase family protein [Candidatus Woesearchaeota archaeon]